MTVVAFPQFPLSISMSNLRVIRWLPLLGIAACGGGSDVKPSAAADSPGGTVVISTPAEPDNLIPPITNTLSGRQIEDLVFEHLAEISPELNTIGDKGFTPSLAKSWTWSADSLSIAFRLDSTSRWHDGAPVTAKDVAFSFALYTDKKTASPTAPLLANIDSVRATDTHTAVAYFHARKPEQFFDLVYQLYILPEHALAAVDRSKLASSPLATMPVGSGPFRVSRWVPKQLLELAVDTTGGRRRAQLDRVLFTVSPDPLTAFARVATGEADLYEAVRPDKVADVAKNPQLRLVLMPSLDYNFLTFNLVDPVKGGAHPIFGDRNVRRALTMATDRRGIVANIYDSLAVQGRGPFSSSLASNDPSLKPLPYDVDSANVILDAAGWVRGADSLRRKNGKVLGFSIAVPSTSVPRMRAAVLLQEQFRRVGADVKVESSDMGGFGGKFFGRKFDAAIAAWAPDPNTGGVRDTWTSAGAAEGGNNPGAYRNPAFDAQVDTAMAAFDPAMMRSHFASAWRIIADDAPAIWLAEPRRTMAIHSRIITTGMRPDSWWAGIAKWRIPADKRIARDAAPGAAR